MKTLELDITFGRDYFTRHFGLTYDRDYFEDVAVRVETDMKARRALHERFGDIGLGEADPERVVQLGYDDTLNVTLMFGGELRVEAGLSWVEPGFLDVEAIDSLKVPDVETTWPHTQFLEQYEEAARLFGPGCVRPPAPHGILEQALDLFGDELLVEMARNPDRAGRLFDVLAETVIRVKEFWDRKCFGEVRKGLSLGGCSTTMLSAGMVARLLAPRYERIATHFGDAFICSCGPTTQHLAAWAGIEGVRYVRCGWGTDLDKAARFLKRRHVKASLNVVRAADGLPDVLERDVLRILNTLREVDHVSVLLIHASSGTSDASVRRLVRTAADFARKNGISISDTVSCRLSGARIAEWTIRNG